MFVEEDELERDKQLLDLRASVLEAEEERLSGQPTMSILEARKALDKRIDILRQQGFQKVTPTDIMVYNWYSMLMIVSGLVFILIGDRKEKN